MEATVVIGPTMQMRNLFLWTEKKTTYEDHYSHTTLFTRVIIHNNHHMQKTFIHKHQLLTEAITHKQTYFLQAKTLKIPYPEMCSDVHIHCFLYELI